MFNFRRIFVVLMAVVMLMSVGCVSQRQADNLQVLYRRSQEQIIDLKAQLAEANARIRLIESAPPQQDPVLLGRLEAAMAERDRLNAALAQAKRALIQASMTTVLPAELNNELVELADSNQQLMQYDKNRGMLKFASDLTFGSGSVKINPQARKGLLQLATLMRKPIAQKFELRVVGHTDNVRIGKAATRAKHPTNWHLSLHRAIAVKDILAKAGISSDRLVVSGHGEFRPVAPNSRRGNSANRRVEIYIHPSTYQKPDFLKNAPAASGKSHSSVPGFAPKRAPINVTPARRAPEAFK